MTVDILHLIKRDPIAKSRWFKGTFGIEREGLRITEDGNIAQTSHPTSLGNRSQHPFIQTDFAESQLEFITPTCHSVKATLEWLSAITAVGYRNLDDDESIWPLSMPYSYKGLSDLRVSQLEDEREVDYRKYLIKRYGKTRQLISGIHFNVGLDNELLKRLYSLTQMTDSKYSSFKSFQNDCYFKIAQHYQMYQWFYVYLFAATPITHKDFFELAHAQLPKLPVRSLRSSKYGYVNDSSIHFDYQSLAEFAKQLTSYVKEGHLVAEKELYEPIRFRGADSITDVVTDGIKYIEFRQIDVDPYDPLGISSSQLYFTHLFLLFLLTDTLSYDVTKISTYKKKLEKVALSTPSTPLDPNLMGEARTILSQMREMLEIVADGTATTTLHIMKEVLEVCEERIEDVSLTPAYAVMDDFSDLEKIAKDSFIQKNKIKETYYELPGFQDLELSTQAIMMDAIRLGLTIEVIDRSDQILRLGYKNHIEYVKDGNMTSLDNYITPLLMANKVVTKKLLAENAIHVPIGQLYDNEDIARQSFPSWCHNSIVIKPKSTNFGLGISILEGLEEDSKQSFEKALTHAFNYDDQVIIELFQPGTEFRFFVLNNHVLAVLKRVPAHIIGDGKNAINSLISTKNSSLLRGNEHEKPLVKITIDESVLAEIKKQGYPSLNAVPPKDKVVYLRRNSNISTGGDSVDMTDFIPDFYKEIAVKAAQTLNAKICGVDMIIDIPKETEQLNQVRVPGNLPYAIIEANFNPMMSMHIFPAIGKSRDVAHAILIALFPEYR